MFKEIEFVKELPKDFRLYDRIRIRMKFLRDFN